MENKTVSLKHVTYETIETVLVKEFPMVNKYFWGSRSVYAVEFNENIYNVTDGDVWHRIILIRVRFEKNIIEYKDTVFNDKFPISTNWLDNGTWENNLMNSFLYDNFFDSRTKEQFDEDYNTVISNLKNLRSFRL